MDQDIPIQIVETHRTREIMNKYAPLDKTMWKHFWELLLCWKEEGIKLLKLDTPFPYAADVVKKWRDEYKIVYFTGRPINMHNLTLNELERFDFPVDNVDLAMPSLKDWSNYLNSKISAIQLRHKLFSLVHNTYNIVRVVDDIPVYFSIYKTFGIKEMIGVFRSKIYSKQEYVSHGATKIINEWKQLLHNL